MFKLGSVNPDFNLMTHKDTEFGFKPVIWHFLGFFLEAYVTQ